MTQPSFFPTFTGIRELAEYLRTTERDDPDAYELIDFAGLPAWGADPRHTRPDGSVGLADPVWSWEQTGPDEYLYLYGDSWNVYYINFSE